MYNIGMLEIQKLKLTPKRLETVKKLGLNTTEDIISYYPVRYENYEITPFAEFSANERVVFVGEIITVPSVYRYGRNNSITRFKVLIEEEYVITLTIFNRPYARMLKTYEKIVVVGKYEGHNKVTVINYYAKNPEDVLGIVPVYALKEGITQNDIRKIIAFTLNKTDNELIDDIPEAFMNRHGLIGYKEAILEIHNPSSKQLLIKAITRLKYQEFLEFYLSIYMMTKDINLKVKEPKRFDMSKIEKLISSFEFNLTDDQKSCLDDIFNDLQSDKLMYRLVEGEVGSGKTVIALLALYATFLSGYKGAMMAPTEILASQHYENFKTMLEPLGVRIALLTGKSKNSQIKADIMAGLYDIIIGTHALFSDDVTIDKLGLVITDEQQRFGVEQRRKLKDKGEIGDFRLMSATPIPRTLASAIYGDMSISIIKTMPKGRKGCDTYLIRQNSITSIIDNLKTVLHNGHQIYIITSSIEKSDAIKVKDAMGIYNSIIDLFAPYRIGILHGKMTSEEKEKTMREFEDNQISILVSTTVVEVGVNVKNATCMVIYDADRFGLSQIHQLRGRVQRSDEKGLCYLLTDSKEEEAIKRLDILTKTNDGFMIAKEDLRLRGPGDLLGTRQSGINNFILGDIMKDDKIMEAAKKDALEMASNPLYCHSDFYFKVLEKTKQKYID